MKYTIDQVSQAIQRMEHALADKPDHAFVDIRVLIAVAKDYISD